VEKEEKREEGETRKNEEYLHPHTARSNKLRSKEGRVSTTHPHQHTHNAIEEGEFTSGRARGQLSYKIFN